MLRQKAVYFRSFRVAKVPDKYRRKFSVLFL